LATITKDGWIMEFIFGFFAGCFTIIGLIWFAVGTTR
jgi:hypothetical protein